MNKFFFLLVFFVLIVGCKSKQHSNITLNRHSSKDLVLTSNTTSRFTSANFLFKRSNFTIESPDLNQSLTGSYYIVKDSFIIFSLQALLGIEVARVKVTSTEVIILDRFNKRASFLNYNSFISKYAKGLSYNVLQSILLNSVFDLSTSDTNNINSSSFTSDFKDSTYIISNNSSGFLPWFSNNKLNIYNQAFSFSTSNGLLVESVISDNELHSSVMIRYSDFSVQDDLLFPLTTNILATVKDKSYIINFNSHNLLLNNNSGINFNIPTSYEKIYK